MQREVEEKSRYAVVTAVQLPSVSDNEFEASLSELRELAKTLGYQVVRTFVQKRSSFDTTAYLGIGKRQEIRSFVNNEPAEFEEIIANPDSRDIDAILVDHEISPSQARNLEKEVGCEVMDPLKRHRWGRYSIGSNTDKYKMAQARLENCSQGRKK